MKTRLIGAVLVAVVLGMLYFATTEAPTQAHTDTVNSDDTMLRGLRIE